MKKTSLLIRSFFGQLSEYPIKQYWSQANTIQSSVGMIFRFPDLEQIESKQEFDAKVVSGSDFIGNTELLFVQRAGYHSDQNAYNVVFPGGQCDPQETDLQACERQLKEEIGILTRQQCIHLGQLPKNFYYLKKRGKQVHISCHAYCLKSSQNQWEPTLNSEELRKFKWVKISDLLKNQNYKRRNEIKLGVFQRMPSFASKIAKENILKVTMQQLDLGMDRNLWGLTLYVWSYVLQMAFNRAKSQLQSQQVSLVVSLIQSMVAFQLQFKPYSFYKVPASIIASGWHYLYRKRPFTYKPGGLYSISRLSINLGLILVCLIAINFYCALL